MKYLMRVRTSIEYSVDLTVDAQDESEAGLKAVEEASRLEFSAWDSEAQSPLEIDVDASGPVSKED